MTIGQTKLRMTFCCSHMMHYHTILAVVESNKFEQGSCLLVMYMKQTGNRADVFTTSLLLVLKKEVFIRANSFKTWLWISFAFLRCYTEVQKNMILLEKQIVGTFLCMGLFSDIMLKLKKMWFCWRSKLPEPFCIWFSVVSLFSKIKWNENLSVFKIFYCCLDLWEG